VSRDGLVVVADDVMDVGAWMTPPYGAGRPCSSRSTMTTTSWNSTTSISSTVMKMKMRKSSGRRSSQP
jgi:hypothetical protein